MLVECTPVQQQHSKYNCGLFAIAWAHHIAMGDDVRSLYLDQQKLRHHLVRCFERRRLSRFPKTKEEVQIFNVDIHAFCRCKSPDSWDNMIQCDNCKRGYT